MKKTRRLLLAAAVGLGLLLSACGSESDHPVEAQDMWSRPTAPGSTNAAIYGTLTNEGDESLALTEMYSQPCGRLEVHVSEEVDGVMEMRPADADISILDPGETLTLVPTGLHFMCLDLAEPMIDGETIPIEFTFAEAGVLATEFEVENR